MLPINIKPGQQDFAHVMLSLRLLTIIAGFAFAGSACAASIGIVAPQNGPYELLGQQVRQGAKAAAAKLGLDVVEIHESCEDGSGGAIADGLVAAKVSAAIGFVHGNASGRSAASEVSRHSSNHAFQPCPDPDGRRSEI